MLNNLKTKTFKSVTFFEKTGSTNEEAIRRAQSGGKEGEIFIADQQTAGRGRLGRKWESPAGKNLYLSFLLKPTFSPSSAPWVTMIAGTAVYDALLPFLPPPLKEELKIKWPNDLYLQDKKIAGILTEMELDSDRIHWIVCGIGVDLNAEAKDFSPEVQKIAGSLKTATGQEIDREEAATRLIEAFEKRYFEFCEKGPGDLVSFCDRHSYLKGKKVTAEGPDGPFQGTVVGLDLDGFLLVRDKAGETVSIIAGDVTPLPVPSPLRGEG